MAATFLGDFVLRPRTPLPLPTTVVRCSLAATPSVLSRSHSCRLAESSASCAAVRLVDPGREMERPLVAWGQGGSDR